MTRHRIVAVLATTAVALGLACNTATKTAAPPATRDAGPEIAPAIPTVPPPPPSAPPMMDAAAEARDAGADTTGVVPAKAGKTGKTGKAGIPREALPSIVPGKRGMVTLDVTGNLPKAVADQVLRAKIGSFATCHDGGQHGRVQIKVTMNDRGVVEIAKVMKSTLGGAETELCLAHVAGRFKFPPPPGGGESTVTFQLTF